MIYLTLKIVSGSNKNKFVDFLFLLPTYNSIASLLIASVKRMYWISRLKRHEKMIGLRSHLQKRKWKVNKFTFFIIINL